ncbi:hypothetical protein [Microbacterium sp. 67-17]|nr:hypothetical protein [Microbacterium sp. 67-17]
MMGVLRVLGHEDAWTFSGWYVALTVELDKDLDHLPAMVSAP